ncbi:TIGR03986 family CRISPR-associated RAMP protein [bacterium]|nr:TIGR03986 family CRISPR-associated RAMP protein [bacterium]
MPTGKIKSFDPGRNIGVITPDDGSQEVKFFAVNLRRGSEQDIKEGVAVYYELRRKAQQPTTHFFEIGRSGASVQKQEMRGRDLCGSPSSNPAHLFLNPYNFVRSLREPQTSENDPDTKLLDQCTPPPHDRWVGLSGRIVCTAEAVTPLFVSDAQACYDSETDEQNEHKSYRFFHYDFGNDPELALPASSLRGMVRSVFEAATNSCFCNFQKDLHALEYREARAPNITPARVLKRNSDGSAALELLDCTKGSPDNLSRKPDTTRAGAVLGAYSPVVFNTKTEIVFNHSDLPANAYDGMRVAALVHCKAAIHKSNRFRSFSVARVVPAHEHHTLAEKTHIKKLFGWLHLTGPNIENKHDERLFFRWDDDQNPDPLPLEQIPQDYIVTAPPEVVAEYDYHLKEYWERNEREVKKLGDKRWPSTKEGVPHPSTFIHKGRRLEEADLVYVLLQNKKPVSLRPVSIPRMRHKETRQQLLSDQEKRCTEYERLCPACRTFGWVYASTDLNEKLSPSDETSAYAGRVRFEHGKRIETADSISAHLAILSSPKPTTTRFYLKPKSQKLEHGLKDADLGYDSGATALRGRKFYRHQGHGGEVEYWKEHTREYHRVGQNSDQNRTVVDALLPKNKFRFTIHFENLAPVELGALLWSLELEGKSYHRMGFAKPLGFGSVRMEVCEMTLLEPQTRYSEKWLSETVESVSETQRKAWVERFKSAMRKAYKTAFDELPNIKDILTLLSNPKPDLPIHYPRPEEKPNTEGKNFEWFMGNKRSDQARFVLELPGEEKGFPLVDKWGNVKL